MEDGTVAGDASTRWTALLAQVRCGHDEERHGTGVLVRVHGRPVEAEDCLLSDGTRTDARCVTVPDGLPLALFRSLGDPWTDTTASHGRLMLTVLGGLAEFERELIRARSGEGRARAKAVGVRMGRPHKLTPHQRPEARVRREAGETLASIARSHNVHHATIGRL